MKLYDISQEVFSCAVYPGDPAPKKQILCSTEEGEVYNLTAFSMCAHNGTHVDAPYHFLPHGKTVEEMPLDHFVGKCYVVSHRGEVRAQDAVAMLEKAQGRERLLIAGPATVTTEAARIFAQTQLKLIGNESQSVGPEDTPMEVHKILLEQGIALLEGIVLTNIPEGEYFLSAAPLKLAGSDGAPCRAYLAEF